MPLVPPIIREPVNADDFSLLAFNFEPHIAGATSTPLAVAGTVYGSRLYLPKAALVTNIEMSIITAGVTLTSGQCFAGLFNAAGTLLSATANQSVAWTTTGPKTMALSAAQSCAVGYYDVCFFFNGTTGPAFHRVGAIGTAQFQNGKLSGAALKYFTADTARTTAFASPLGAKTVIITNYWVGLS